MTGAPHPLHRCEVCGETVPGERARVRLTCGGHVPGDRWNAAFKIRAAAPEEADDVRRLWTAFWGHDDVFCFDRVWPLVEHETRVADAGGALAGAIATHLDGSDGFVLALAVPPVYQGFRVGSSLLSSAEARLRGRGATRVRLSTTNDNLPALQFFQRRGYVVEEVLPGTVARYLEDRPGEVPGGFAGIPVRDEIRLAR